MPMEISELPSRPYESVPPEETVFRRLRNECPVMRLTGAKEGENVVLLTLAQDVQAMIANSRVFASRSGPQARRFDSNFDESVAAIFADGGWPIEPVLVWADGEEHSRQRRLVVKAFSPARMEEKAPYIAAMVEELIDGFQGGGEVEFMGAFAARLPAMVMTREFGLARDKVDTILAANVAILTALDPDTPVESVIESAHAMVGLQRMLMERIRAFEHKPESNLLSDLVHARDGDIPTLNPTELLSVAVVLLIAGSHSSSALIAWCLYMLALLPEMQDRLRSDPARIADFVEEVLRVHPPFTATYRTALAETELHGVRIPAGTDMLGRWDSSNMDERKWQSPERFDIDRPNLRAHTSFGFGKHLCIGNQLVRTEAQLAVAAMLRRFRHIAFAAPTRSIVAVPSFVFHTLAQLPLHLDP